MKRIVAGTLLLGALLALPVAFGAAQDAPAAERVGDSEFVFVQEEADNMGVEPEKTRHSAPPAATEHLSAAKRQSEPNRRISSFKRPAAESILAALSEFEHTSSARRSLLCAGVFFPVSFRLSRYKCLG